MPPDRTSAEPKRKPRIWKPPVNRKPRAKREEKPKTSAKVAIKERHENLTTYDWLQVFVFMDKNPGMSQIKVVDHFSSRPKGALVFTQAMLLRHLAARKTLEERVGNEPGALSSKRCCIVT
ncbi:hypothetical protein M422DRAFT_269208 [Sphaerobolus stellatus SS14]|uniref:Uncharacterized protein n=1 Tax=Sphaerobolus stellatus (strain SS14) TaxID=990650 RepID=A0A0C9UVN8_SPHS4|nr:hypothetical protein M422DRAFT_269208 [Sphaerobolus stellatus SS14]